MEAKTKLFIAAGAAGAAVLWFVGRKLEALPAAVGAVFSGDNAVTRAARTDVYQDAGVLGTFGAAADVALGGVPSRIGETLGSWFYDVTH